MAPGCRQSGRWNAVTDISRQAFRDTRRDGVDATKGCRTISPHLLVAPFRPQEHPMSDRTPSSTGRSGGWFADRPIGVKIGAAVAVLAVVAIAMTVLAVLRIGSLNAAAARINDNVVTLARSEEHTSELQSRQYLVCRLLLEKKNQISHQ